jgi:hypothetical protein
MLRIGTSLTIAMLATFASVAVVGAYTSPGSTLITTSSCATANQGSRCTLTFQLRNANGGVEANATVTISVSGVQGATVQPSTATTDANGSVQAIFSAGTSGCGTATVTVSSPPASTQTTINVACNSAGTLPNNSTSPPTTPLWLPVLVALALVTVAVCGVTLRRIRVTSS